MSEDVLDPGRMAAWCIVPYDSERRGPADRAAMLADLGFAGEVWDWRDEHVAQFGAECDALAKRDLELFGFWTPHVTPARDEEGLGAINPAVRGFVAEAATRGITPQLWTCLEFGEPGPVPEVGIGEHTINITRHAIHLEPLADLAGANGMEVALYNHLGWAGEPSHMIAIIDSLRSRGIDNVRIVYQQHHAHHRMDDWPDVLASITPHLAALGLNGMVPGAHWGDGKIHPYGHGPRDVEFARAVVDSGWDGLVTLLCHTMDDAEARLRDNLEGLAWVRAQLAGDEAELPTPRVPAPVWPH